MSNPVDRLSHALADRYRIERELGQGGMATVYLAEDLKHHRKVAVKVLKPELAAVLGAERFVQEITTTAALQHPHILPLFDSGTADGFLYYVMPFIDGETLRSKLDRETQLGIDEAVRIASNVADALDYAHRHGVIHRDIKPENILLHDGRPMVADFGIALAVSAAAGGRMTETGLSLGTPHYMSPEQATAEKEITGRSDIYSLGSVLYEMLTGSPPHVGASAQQIIMKIVTEEAAPVTKLRKAVPPNVAAAVAQALEKLPADRFATAREFADALSSPSYTRPMSGIGLAVSASGTRWKRMALAVSVVAIAGVALALWGWFRPTAAPMSRSVMGFLQGQALTMGPEGTHLAVSRDGSILVYTGDDSTGSRLWVKRRHELAAVPIAGTDGAYDPFLSPDGTQVGFFSEQNGRAMKRVALDGGLPQVVTGRDLGVTGASWASDGYIYFDADDDGLQRVKPDGSGRETVAALDSAQKEIGFAWPQVLPGNKTVIMRLRHAGDDASAFEIVAVRIGNGQRSTVVRAVSARFVGGQLLYITADGTLQAAPFNERNLTLEGPPRVIATGVRIAGTYAGADLTVSERGALYYVAGAAGLNSHLEWVARDGTSNPVDPTWQQNAQFQSFALSPDGSRVAIALFGQGFTSSDIWIKELPVGPLTRLTVDPGFDVEPVWSGDGRSVLFVSGRVENPFAVYRRQADGLGDDVLVVRSERAISAVDESKDGRWLVAQVAGGETSADIVFMEIGRDTAPRLLIATPSQEGRPALSPDGRWIAYVSSATGRPEVYVRPFPDVESGRWQVSITGGLNPKWSHSGATVFFTDPEGATIRAVSIQTTPTFSRSSPQVVFRRRPESGLLLRIGYDVSLDDNLFLMVGRGATNTESQLVRIDDVLQELQVKQPR